MISIYIIYSSLLLIVGVSGYNETHRTFPQGFQFGGATSSYQIEGSWNVSDKGENIWDRFAHTPGNINNGDTGDVACDSYNQYPRDVEMLMELGVDYYRFSISWARILPTGFDNEISEDGIAYYNNLIDLLLANGITPYITLYHWELPQSLQDIGGWANPLMEKYFTDYARVCFEVFGDRVKNWLTLNEPHIFCVHGYGTGFHAPGLSMSARGEYLCGHTALKAHASVYHLYDEVFRPTQNGRISITLDTTWFEPENRDNPDDVLAAEIAMQFEMGWFAKPIFSEEGDYPEIMKSNIAAKSAEQGYSSSRLPSFTAEEIEYIKGTYDFFGLNHYSSNLARFYNSSDVIPEHTIYEDKGVYAYLSSEWHIFLASNFFARVPWGFKNLLVWIKDTYNNPELIVFENGYSDFGGTSDVDRVILYHQYINAMLDAIDEGCAVTSYTAWSLMDNFEWSGGYSQRFGIFSVDFDSPNKARTIKDSGRFYADIIRTRFIERSD